MAADIAASTAKLHKILLSWDYWELVRRTEEGEGPSDETLRPVQDTFKDIKARTRRKHTDTRAHRHTHTLT
jgi:hypothetical protein